MGNSLLAAVVSKEIAQMFLIFSRLMTVTLNTDRDKTADHSI